MRHRLYRLAIVVALAAATLAYGSLDKKVVVRVEGEPVAVRTFATSVKGALERAGIPVGPKDRVVPEPTTPLRDGAIIEVYRAKPITLLLDGKPRRVIVTGLTVEEVIREIELRGTMADHVRPSRASRIQAGMVLTYKRAALVTVRHDDKVEQVITNAPSVAAVLRELKIAVGKTDRVIPAPSAKPAPGMTVRVLRIGIRQEIREVTLPYQTILRRDRSLELGVRKVAQPGRTGLRRMRYQTKYVDGRRVSRKVLGYVTVRAPKPRIILIGAGYPGCACDRGTELGKATWYSQADGLTAAHKTLPFGTVVRVENLANGKWVNVVIRDRGPYGDNRIIDLSDEAFRRLAPLSTGVIRVRIRW